VRAAISILLVLGATAFADPTTEAKRFVDAGVAARNQGDYDGAIELFLKAHATLPNPLVLYNVAQTHREAMGTATDPDARARHRDGARDYYRQFIATKPAEELLLKAQGWVFQLDALYAIEHPQEEAARRDRLAAAEEAKIREEQARLAAQRKARAERDAQEAANIALAVREQQLGKARTVKIIGLSVAGGGVLATAVGVIYGLRAASISDELTASNIYDPGKIADGNSAARTMAIAYIAGGTLILGGAVTYLFGAVMAANVESVAVTPTSGGAAISFGGAF